MTEEGAAQSAEPQAGVDPLLKGTGLGCLGIIGAFAAIFVVGGLFGDDSSDGPSGYEAEKQCERFIEDRLKAPASAEFDLSTTGGPTTFTSSGTVDSQNSFGAMIRNDVRCTITLEGDTWRLKSLTGLTN